MRTANERCGPCLFLMRESGIDDEVVEFWRLWMNALRNTQPRLLAYLSYMVERLLIMKGLLRPNGSIYLHCDPTASHYIKIMKDAIFGHRNFKSEIIWKRTTAHSGARRFGPVHDVILFYTVGPKFTWNVQFGEYDPRYIAEFFTHTDEGGRRWRRTDLTGPGRAMVILDFHGGTTTPRIAGDTGSRHPTSTTNTRR